MATVTPASRSRRADGYGDLVENSAPGSSVATVDEFAKSSTSSSFTNVQWSTLAQSISTAKATPPVSPSWFP